MAAFQAMARQWEAAISHDEATLSFYAAEAEAYVARDADRRYDALQAFMAALPVGAAVLELGCGAGRDSALMLARGFDVTPTDGAPAMAREAERRLGRSVKVLLFADLDDEDRYDGVWASASLLHAPRAGLPGIIGRIHAVLRPGGRFFASYKSGAGEGRDRSAGIPTTTPPSTNCARSMRSRRG